MTDREQDVLQYLLVSDSSVQDIAQQMAISRPVLYRHISSLNEKTGTKSRIGLLQFYYEWIPEKKTPPLKKARILGLETNVTPCYLRKNSIKTKKEMNVTLYFRILHAILCLRDWRGDLKSSIALCQNF